MMVYTFYSDPGHGWLRVPMNELIDLDIAPKISAYSYVYRNGKWVYLEEDIDAGKFIDAYVERHGTEPQIVYKYSDNRSDIRNYVHYDAQFVQWLIMDVPIRELIMG